MANKIKRVSDSVSIADVKADGPRSGGIVVMSFVSDDDLEPLIEHLLARRVKKARSASPKVVSGIAQVRKL